MEKIVIGLTGGIASGKTTILNEFKKFKYIITADCDEICHRLYNDKKIIKMIIKNFGTDILIDGEIDRKKLGGIVFSLPEKRRILERILHPFIIDEIKNKIKKFRKNNSKKLMVVDIPLLFEVNLTNLVDKILLAYAPRKIQIQRLMKRDKLSKEEIIKRLNSQLPWRYKLQKADYIINTTKKLGSIRKKINKIISNLLNLK